MMMPMMMLTWTLVMTTMMMVTCMGLSWTLYSFSSSLPRRPLPFLLTGLKMQSSDLSGRDHIFGILAFPFFRSFDIHLILSQLSWKVQFIGKNIELSITL